MTTPDFPNVLDRANVVALPQVLAQRLISGVVQQSAALSAFAQVPTTTKGLVIPVLSKDIEASWVAGGDAGLKSADVPAWEGVHLLAAAELPSQQGYLVDRAVVRPGW